MRYFLVLLCLLTNLISGTSAYAAGPLRILLTNDDGFESPGIKAMHQALTEAGHNVFIIAPATQQSGASASITSSGVRVTEYPGQIWAVHGKPADAVRVGLGYILFDTPPDLVISGANFGQNSGQDVNISGTVGAAITAHRLAIPAIAISVEIRLDEAKQGFPSTVAAFSGAGRLLVRLIRQLDLDDLTAVLNVNYPAVLPLDVKGVRWSDLSNHSILSKRYNKRPDGFYVPEFVKPYQHARKHDAESLVDGWVTLTFLDGNMSIKTHRSQKYLDEGLLDRNYEPTYQPARVARKPLTGIKPSNTPATESALASKQQRRPVMPEAPKDEQIVEFKEATPAAALRPHKTEDTGISSPERPITNVSAPRDADQAETPLAVEEEMIVPPLQREAKAETDEASGSEAEEQRSKETRKKKPDSWLRRIFDPDSWRR